MYKTIIKLGNHPYADMFLNKKHIGKLDKSFPLICEMNKKTGHIKNKFIFDAHSRYNKVNYSYTSSNSNYSKAYWKSYFKEINSYIKINKNTKVLEIGSNDGYLLSLFKNKTKKILGVDASNQMVKISNYKKVRSIQKIFNYKSSKNIKKKFGSFDLIIANNVLNHANNANDFVKGIKYLLKNNGLFIAEQPYWLKQVQKFNLDMIYHEHINYITVKYSIFLCKKNNLELFKVKNTPYHGGSIRLIIKNRGNKKKLSNDILKKVSLEKNSKIYNIQTYKNIMKKLYLKKEIFINKVKKIKQKKSNIIAVGAAAKGNTILNFLELNRNQIDYVTDNSKLKINKYTPKSNIKIVADSVIKKYNKNFYVFILIWNMKKLIKKKILRINPKAKFINFK